MSYGFRNFVEKGVKTSFYGFASQESKSHGGNTELIQFW